MMHLSPCIPNPKQVNHSFIERKVSEPISNTLEHLKKTKLCCSNNILQPTVTYSHESLFLAQATCPSWVDCPCLCHLIRSLGCRYNLLLNHCSPCGREKRHTGSYILVLKASAWRWHMSHDFCLSILMLGIGREQQSILSFRKGQQIFLNNNTIYDSLKALNSWGQIKSSTPSTMTH